MKENFDYNEVPSGYLHCLMAECPRSSDCLRYQVTLRASSETVGFMSINPNYFKKLAACPHFQADAPLRMPVGIKHLYDRLTRIQEDRVRKRILSRLGHGLYYRIYREERLIKPDVEAFIRQVFEEEVGVEPVFDNYVEGYDFIPELQ